MKRSIVVVILICFCSTYFNGQDWMAIINEGKPISQTDENIEKYLKETPNVDRNYVLKQYHRWKTLAQFDYEPDQAKAKIQEEKRWQFAKQFRSELNLVMRNNFGTWENVTPDTLLDGVYPNYGVVTAITFDSSDEDKLYVGTFGSGLFRRNEDGSWDDLTFGMPVQGVSGVAVNDNVIMCLTGWKFNFNFQGILISEDYGVNWKMINPFIGSLPATVQTFGLKVHPMDFNKQYALTSSGIIYTDDAWNTFTQKTITESRDLIFHPTNPDIIYLSNLSKVFQADSDLNNRIEIFEDTNADYNLMAISNIFPYPMHIAACATDGSNTVNFYRRVNDSSPFEFRSTQMHNQLGWNWNFTIHPENSQLFFGAVNFFKSNDGGSTWEDIGGKGLHDDQQGSAWRGNQLFLINDGGISFTSTFVRDSWDASYTIGLKHCHITNFDVHNNECIAGFFHAGSQVWTIGDNKSTRVTGNDGFECFYDPSAPLNYYSTSQFSGFHLNGGPVIKPNDESYWDQPFFPDPGHDDFLYYCNKRVYRYNKMTGEFLDLEVIGDTVRIDAMGICKNQSTIGYTSMTEGTSPKFIRFSIGNPPQDLSDSLPPGPKAGERISKIVVDDFNPDKLWIVIAAENSQNIFMSLDGANTWTYIGGPGLPFIPILTMVRQQSNNQIYVGTEYGVYYKDDSMDDWIRFSNGLGYQRTVDLDIDNGYIYASFWGSGIWRTPLKSSCPNNRYLTNAVYPNPYNPGYARFEANNSIFSNLELTTNIGTDIEISGNQKVVLLPGFKATSIENIPFDYVTKPRIQIKSEGCRE